ETRLPRRRDVPGAFRDAPSTGAPRRRPGPARPAARRSPSPRRSSPTAPVARRGRDRWGTTAVPRPGRARLRARTACVPVPPSADLADRSRAAAPDPSRHFVIARAARGRFVQEIARDDDRWRVKSTRRARRLARQEKSGTGGRTGAAGDGTGPPPTQP